MKSGPARVMVKKHESVIVIVVSDGRHLRFSSMDELLERSAFLRVIRQVRHVKIGMIFILVRKYTCNASAKHCGLQNIQWRRGQS